jgi:hypothetical protein
LDKLVFSLFDVKSVDQLCIRFEAELAYLDCSCLAGAAAFNLSVSLFLIEVGRGELTQHGHCPAQALRS